MFSNRIIQHYSFRGIYVLFKTLRITIRSGCILVSTNVGGVPELLPSSRIILKEPNVNDLVSGLRSAISCVENNHVQHPRVLSEEDKQILEK